MTYANHPLMEAARYNDARAEERGIEATLDDIGVNIETLDLVADQRALRLLILMSHGESALKQMESSGVTKMILSPSESAMVEWLKIACLDGVLIGWEGKRLNDEASK
jgi:hypothetical protein